MIPDRQKKRAMKMCGRPERARSPSRTGEIEEFPVAYRAAGA
jgi:hypothetical protein